MAILQLFTIIALNTLAAQAITNINQLTAAELKMANWVRTYTVPNTRNAEGNPWNSNSLPPRLLSSNEYKNNPHVKTSAWAAAVVSAYAVTEGIWKVGDFYHAPKSPDNGYYNPGLHAKRCDACFAFPAQLPPKTDFPTSIFSYSLCQGEAGNPDPKTETYGKICHCESTNYPGKLIGPNQNCYPRSTTKYEADWQNGMWGMEQGNVGGAVGMATRAAKIYTAIKKTNWTYRDVLAATLTQVVFPEGTQIYNNVMQCVPIQANTGQPRKAEDLTWTCADLVSMWLTRNHLVGLTVALHDNDNYQFEDRLSTIETLAVYYNS